MGGGAVVAAAAAVHKRRIQAVVDAFRLGDATAPERAQSLEALRVAHGDEFDELNRGAVVQPGPEAGTWYLSERAYIEHRSRSDRSLRARLMVLVAIAIALLAIVAVVSIAGNHSSAR